MKTKILLVIKPIVMIINILNFSLNEFLRSMRIKKKPTNYIQFIAICCEAYVQNEISFYACVFIINEFTLDKKELS